MNFDLSLVTAPLNAASTRFIAKLAALTGHALVPVSYLDSMHMRQTLAEQRANDYCKAEQSFHEGLASGESRALLNVRDEIRDYNRRGFQP